MLETVLTIIFVTVIGAIIGGLTNYIAIKMLFRPFHPIYIGKWKLPFTPGLVPKRRGQIATQLGKLVVEHLLTPEMLEKKWKESQFNDEIVQLLNKKVTETLRSEKSLNEYLEWLGIKDIGNKLNEAIFQKMKEYLNKAKVKHADKQLGEILPQRLEEYIQKQIPIFSSYILVRIRAFLEGEQGRKLLENRLNNLVEGKGTFGSMLQSLMGNLHVTERLQAEIIHLIDDDLLKQTIINLLTEEFDKLKGWTVAEILLKFETSELNENLEEQLKQTIRVDEILNRSISSFSLDKVEQKLTETIIPELVEKGSEKLLSLLPEMLEKIDIPKMVEDQVNSFSLEHLEALIISFTKRELTMITYLGAYIGGLIGLVQGIILQIW